MNQKLKTCPFCGSEAKLMGGPLAQEPYSVWCKNESGKRHHLNCGTMCEATAISEWNSRPEDPRVAELEAASAAPHLQAYWADRVARARDEAMDLLVAEGQKCDANNGLPAPRFMPGQEVFVGEDIPGVIERLIYPRNATVPLYLVEWWDCGDLKAREFHEQDIVGVIA